MAPLAHHYVFVPTIGFQRTNMGSSQREVPECQDKPKLFVLLDMLTAPIGRIRKLIVIHCVQDTPLVGFGPLVGK